MRQSTTRNAREIQEPCYSTCRNEKSFPGVPLAQKHMAASVRICEFEEGGWLVSDVFGLFHGGGRGHADQNKYESLKTSAEMWG